MWDFSWLERRWPGAGYEDWDRVLDELVDRGYDAVRIDAYPHLVATRPDAVWRLQPVWDQHAWGAPAPVEVRVQPALNVFIARCRDRGVRVGLSTWYREDADNTRMAITSAEVMAAQWIATVRSIEEAGLLDAIFYVDLCNEWPGELWAPYFTNEPPQQTWGNWHSAPSMAWMRAAVAGFRAVYPQIPVGFSFDLREPHARERDLTFVDYAEPHVWMVQARSGEFYREVGYTYERFASGSYLNLARRGRALYRGRRDHWRNGLRELAEEVAALSRHTRLPLMTTECWAVVDYKDWPGLEWDWIKELCELGVETAAASGRWLAMATSNFCGPQFVGMWREIEWHTRQTERIKTAAVSPDLLDTMLARRIAGAPYQPGEPATVPR